MKILDFLKPKAATLPTGGYESATRYSQDRSFIYSDSTSDQTDNYARTEILQIARYLTNNFALVERLLSLCESYSVNSGIAAQAATTNSDFNDAATAHFDKWASSQFSTSTGDVNIYELQKLCVRELLVSGEVFLVMSKAESGYPQIIPVQSEQVRRSTTSSKDPSNNGIFYSAKGRPTAYQIWFNDNKPTRVSSSDVIHLKRNKILNQRRGVSAFAASLNSLRDVKDLQTLEKRSIKTHSALAATVTKRNGGEVGDGLFGRNRPAVPTEQTDIPRNTVLEKAFGGAIAYLGDGEKVDLVQSSRSTQGFLSFVELLMRDVCLNLSLSYEFVVNPTALSSAATRFVVQDADYFFSGMQSTLINGMMQRLYGWVIASAIKDDKLVAPADLPDWYAATWVTPQRATIDAGRKDATELKFVEEGLISHDTFFSSRGKNWKEEMRQVAIERAYEDDLVREYSAVDEDDAQLGAAAANGTEDVAATALNGAQISGLQAMAVGVADGSLAKESAKAMARASFPLLSPQTINDIFDPIVVRPPAEPTPSTP